MHVQYMYACIVVMRVCRYEDSFGLIQWPFQFCKEGSPIPRVAIKSFQCQLMDIPYIFFTGFHQMVTLS